MELYLLKFKKDGRILPGLYLWNNNGYFIDKDSGEKYYIEDGYYSLPLLKARLIRVSKNIQRFRNYVGCDITVRHSNLNLKNKNSYWCYELQTYFEENDIKFLEESEFILWEYYDEDISIVIDRDTDFEKLWLLFQKHQKEGKACFITYERNKPKKMTEKDHAMLRTEPPKDNEQKIFIYESPDGGNTIYKREFGSHNKYEERYLNDKNKN